MSTLKDEGGRPEDQMIAIALNTCREKHGITRKTGTDTVDMMYIGALGRAINLNLDTDNLHGED
jgi:hypothetical protein